MAVSNIKATFKCDVQKVWDVVTSLESYGWRSDFTEDVTAKKIVMRPFIKAFLKKQQAAYVADLEKALFKEMD